MQEVLINCLVWLAQKKKCGKVDMAIAVDWDVKLQIIFLKQSWKDKPTILTPIISLKSMYSRRKLCSCGKSLWKRQPRIIAIKSQ